MEAGRHRQPDTIGEVDKLLTEQVPLATEGGLVVQRDAWLEIDRLLDRRNELLLVMMGSLGLQWLDVHPTGERWDVV